MIWKLLHMEADWNISLGSFILLLVPLIVRAILDEITIEKKHIYIGKTLHRNETFVTGFIGFGLCVFVWHIEEVQYLLQVVALWWLSMFAPFFDILINKLRGKKWNYVDTEPDASYWDQMLDHVGKLGAIFIRLFIFVLGIYLCFFLSVTQIFQ